VTGTVFFTNDWLQIGENFLISSALSRCKFVLFDAFEFSVIGEDRRPNGTDKLAVKIKFIETL